MGVRHVWWCRQSRAHPGRVAVPGSSEGRVESRSRPGVGVETSKRYEISVRGSVARPSCAGLEPAHPRGSASRDVDDPASCARSDRRRRQACHASASWPARAGHSRSGSTHSRPTFTGTRPVMTRRSSAFTSPPLPASHRPYPTASRFSSSREERRRRHAAPEAFALVGERLDGVEVGLERAAPRRRPARASAPAPPPCAAPAGSPSGGRRRGWPRRSSHGCCRRAGRAAAAARRRRARSRARRRPWPRRNPCPSARATAASSRARLRAAADGPHCAAPW